MSSGVNNVNERLQFAFDLNLEAVVDGNYDSPDNSDLCTICLEPLLVNTDRTIVTLMCNHKFHIGNLFISNVLIYFFLIKSYLRKEIIYNPFH